MNDDFVRAALVEEALSWEKTRWHHRARLKGVGVDCANFLVAAGAAVGLMPDIQLEPYPIDWHLHRDEPRFLKVLREYADPVYSGPPDAGAAALARPGDIAMFCWGRHAAHGAIVIRWPDIVHAYAIDGMVVRSDASKGELAERFAGLWCLKALL